MESNQQKSLTKVTKNLATPMLAHEINRCIPAPSARRGMLRYSAEFH